MPKYRIFSTMLFQQHVKEQHAVDMLLINLQLITALALHHAVGFAMQVLLITVCRGKKLQGFQLEYPFLVWFCAGHAPDGAAAGAADAAAALPEGVPGLGDQAGAVGRARRVRPVFAEGYSAAASRLTGQLNQICSSLQCRTDVLSGMCGRESSIFYNLLCLVREAESSEFGMAVMSD